MSEDRKKTHIGDMIKRQDNVNVNYQKGEEVIRKQQDLTNKVYQDTENLTASNTNQPKEDILKNIEQNIDKIGPTLDKLKTFPDRISSLQQKKGNTSSRIKR